MKHSISLSIFLVSVLLMGCKQSVSEPLQPEPEPGSKYEIHGRIFHPCFDWTVSNLGNNIGDTLECGFWFSPYEDPRSDEEYSITLQKVVVESSTMQLHMEGKINLNSYDECFVRPYIRTRFSARYGESFIVKPDPLPSFMKTGIITDITYSSANVTYQIESKGKSDITEYGIEWSTSAEFNYTSRNSNRASSSDQDKLVSQPVTFAMASLQANTLYYVRAYAENSYGTGYSETWEVKTTAVEKQAVDLGLSVKWANMNVGADSPESYGDYFAWGETKPKTNYSWSTYKYCVGGEDGMTKYCMSRYEGSMDEITTLEPQDDAAYVNWGSNWRTPTQAEWKELINNCTWTWKNRGYVVTAKNGNSIFLPAAGAYDGIYNNYIGGGNYWSSSLYTSDSNRAWFKGFNSGTWSETSASQRYHGMSVRAVCQ